MISFLGVCPTNLIKAEALFTSKTDQVESVDFAYLEFSKAFDLVCHRLLAKKVVAMGSILSKTTGVNVTKEPNFKSDIGW